MFGFIPQALIGLLIFEESLVIKCVSLSNKLCMIRPTLIYSDLVKFSYYQFVIN